MIKKRCVLRVLCGEKKNRRAWETWMNNIYESFLRPFGGKRQSRARGPFMVICVFSITRSREWIGALSAPMALNRLTCKLLIGAPKLFLAHLIVHQVHQLRKDGKTRPKKVRRLRIFVPRRGTFLSHGDNLIKCRLIVKFSREFTPKPQFHRCQESLGCAQVHL